MNPNRPDGLLDIRLMTQFTAAQILALLPHAFLILDRNGTVQEANQAACQFLRTEHYQLVGKPIVDLMEPSSKEKFSQVLDEVLRKRVKVHGGEVNLNGIPEAPILVEYTLSALTDTTPPVVVVIFRPLQHAGHSLHDSTLFHEELVDSYQNLMRLNQQLVHRHNYLDLLYRLAHTLNRSLELDQVLHEALHGMIAMFQGQTGYLVLLSDEHRPLRWIGSDDTLRITTPMIEVSLAEGLEAEALSERVMLCITDITQKNPNHQHPLPGRSFLVIPLETTIGITGILTVAHEMPGAFDTHQETIIAAAADTVALALQNARNYTQLRDAEIARERMTRLLIHDIRGPLSATAASINVVQRVMAAQSMDDVTQQIVQEAMESGKRGINTVDELTSNLLEITRLRSGKQPLEKETINIEELYREHIISMMQSVATHQDITLHYHVSSPDLTMLGDKRLLKRMLLNLLSNALKFTPAGGNITLHASSLPGKDDILLVVEDTGPGVAPEDRERIFEIFLQGKGESHRGTGLGLSLCREVALAHGGRIWVEERPGGGSRFCIQIPADKHI